MNPKTPLKNVNGVGEKFLPKLEKLGLKTVQDLLYHFPRKYKDFSETKKIDNLQEGEKITVEGQITDSNTRKSWKKKFIIFEIEITDETGSIKAVWFNQPYLQNVLERGQHVQLSGEVDTHKGSLQFSNPIYEKTENKDTLIHTGRILPIYPETKGLTSRGLRYLIHPLLKQINFKENIPEKIRKEQNLKEINDSLKKIHFPKNKQDIKKANKRFSFEDLFILQLYNQKQRQKLKKQKSYSIKQDIQYVKDRLSELPFDLTTDQKKTLWEILKDLNKENPMNRLLQGDVGSGKTVVALISSLLSTQKGYQVAFMAPTEILADQHFETTKNLFKNFEQGLGLLTGSGAKVFYGEGLQKEVSKDELKDKIKQNEIKFIIGTHALIQDEIKFPKLGLVIVDEQHRFGVKQRSALVQDKQDHIPHFLSMTATPIPRTLSLTIFGDLDLSTIQELPADRKPVTTKVIPPSQRKKAYKFIKKEVEKGRQAFVICPRIEKNEDDDNSWDSVKAVKEEYEKLSEKVFPDLKVDMLHGQIGAEEKNEKMRKFSKGKTDILVSTSVVEVGIDVPNATIMMVEGAERFGLAQLYQFQGRVGRGEHKSYCFLFTDSKSASTHKRLRSIVEADNGLELAQKDLAIRGPGEFLGQAQSGMPDLAMKAIKNPKLAQLTKNSAKKIFKEDPSLEKYPRLKEDVKRFEERVHKE
ncbi:MAG: ATP-dependent DNA helicase RecG [Candidatus Magasanikbacteria bacterium]